MKPSLFLSLLLGFFILACSPSKKRPNILLIMTDDLGWGDTGFNGNKILQTPALDYLASNGVIFDRFYSASAVCSPTRASCITGRNPFRIGIPGANSGHMKAEEITLPELLKEEGYATAHFGKWHLGTLTTQQKDANRGRPGEKEHYSIPTMHGYDEFFCTESKVPTYDPLIKPLEYDTAAGESLHYGWKAISDKSRSESYGTSYWKAEEVSESKDMNGDDSWIIMNKALPFIEQSVKNEQPFFSTIWFHTPHLPVVADETHRNLYDTLDLQRQIYFATITTMDEQIARLWLTLESLGVADNTMIWFCSDNGPERNTPGNSGGFRERKRSLYEGGVRVPAFVIWKNGITENNIRTHAPAVTSDYLPTILDMLDIDYPDKRPIDGESLSAVLTGKKKERVKPIGFLYQKKMSWVTNQYKLFSTDKGNTFELYDLINDKAEKHNIIEQNTELAETMKQELFAWMESVDNSNNGGDY